MATIKKQGKGYKITVSNGYDLTGKQIRTHMTWVPEQNMTAKQIEKELNRQAVLFEENVKKGACFSGNMKFAEFIDLWIQDYGNAQLKARTLLRYEELAIRVKASIGHVRLDRLTPKHLLDFYALLAEPGQNQRTGGGMSPKSIKHYHTFISSVLGRAVKWGLLSDNPARRIDAPKVPKESLSFLDEREIQIFAKALDDEPIMWRALFCILALTGMRRGEVLGLEWPDIDFDQNTILITRTSQYSPTLGIYTDTPKTESSKRRISMSESLSDLLRLYKSEQTDRIQSLGDFWVPEWHDAPRLFTQDNGKPMHPNAPYQRFQRILQRCGLPHVSLHSLRHTNASLLIQSGADIRTVSGRLGHSQTSTTLNVYAEFLHTADELAAQNVSNAILGGKG